MYSTSLLFVFFISRRTKSGRQLKLLVMHVIYLRCLQYTTFNITCATYPPHSLITSCASALASMLRIPPPFLLANALAAKTASPPKLVLGFFFFSLPPPAVLFREASFVSAAYSASDLYHHNRIRGTHTQKASCEYEKWML